MPQATNELRAKFPGDDAEALDVIQVNFIQKWPGVIWRKTPDYQPTSREWDAIVYLFSEWDYLYETKI